MLSPLNANLSHPIFAFPTVSREAAWGARDTAALPRAGHCVLLPGEAATPSCSTSSLTSVPDPKRVARGLAKGKLCKNPLSSERTEKVLQLVLAEAFAINWQNLQPFPAWQLQTGNC